MKLGLKVTGTPLDKIILVLAAALLVLSLFLYLGQRTTAPALAKLELQVEAARKELRSVLSQPDPESLRKDIAKLQASSFAFPTAERAEEAIASLWNWSRDSGVILEQMSLSSSSSTVADWAYPSHNFPVSGRGSPETVSRFMKLLMESDLKTVGVSQLQIAFKSSSEWQFSFVYSVWSEGAKVVAKAEGK